MNVILNAVGVFLYREILCYPTPINFNYWYGIGLLLVFLLVNQVLTGIQVGSYYIVSIDVALSLGINMKYSIHGGSRELNLVN